MSLVNPNGRGYTLTYNDFVELIFPSRSHWSVDISIQQSVQEFEMDLSAERRASIPTNSHHEAHVKCLEHLAVLEEFIAQSGDITKANEIEAMRVHVMRVYHTMGHATPEANS